MNSFFISLGIQSWKPLFTALLLPPVPLLMLLLIGAVLLAGRRALGWTVVLTSVLMLWFSSCIGASEWLSHGLLNQSASLSNDRVKALKSHAKEPVAIVVLGGGMEQFAPEYRTSSLQYRSLERLRYGVWLSRETGWPVAFSGGAGWGQPDGATEAQVAQRIASQEFGRPLKWVEDGSRDTRENAARTIALLRPHGVKRILLVTHHWHMPRSMRAFEEAAGGDIRIEAAPMGLARHTELPVLRWLPSGEGLIAMRVVLREWMGQLAGA